MKRVFIVSIILSIFFLSSCSSNIPEKPSDSNLDFWITENVENIDFSDYEEIFGWFGASEFLGKEYSTIKNENGENIKPEHYVSYIITAYPDYSNGGEYVTRIDITDPKVQIYGLCVTSNLLSFDTLFENMDYEVEEVGNTGLCHKAVKGKISFTYGNGSLIIAVEVTNRFGIQF